MRTLLALLFAVPVYAAGSNLNQMFRYIQERALTICNKTPLNQVAVYLSKPVYAKYVGQRNPDYDWHPDADKIADKWCSENP